MTKFHSNSIKALAFSASAIAFVIAGPAYAQDAEVQPAVEEEQVDVTAGEAAKAEEKTGNITVTGSRIVRDTYSSISPLQVLTTENQQAVGAFDPAQILQRSAAAAGTQIDATFNGFVLDNGPEMAACFIAWVSAAELSSPRAENLGRNRGHQGPRGGGRVGRQGDGAADRDAVGPLHAQRREIRGRHATDGETG